MRRLPAVCLIALAPLATAGVLCVSRVRGQPVQPQPEKPQPPPNQMEQVVLATGHSLTLPQETRPHARYFSFWDVSTTPDNQNALWTRRRYLSWWLHQMTFERAINLPQEVPGSSGRLVWVDLRWYGWDPRAWAAVAERDPFTLEPGVPYLVAESLRRSVDYQSTKAPPKTTTAVSSLAANTRPVGALVNGDWFIRETLETRRSPSYYDLLFSQFRYPKKAEASNEKPKVARVPYEVEEEVDEPVKDAHGNIQRYYNSGQPVTRKVKKKTTKFREVVGESGVQPPDFVDFPKNTADWDRAFGIEVIRTFGKDREVSLDFGAVVAGGRDDPANGSIVALNNRLLVMQTGAFGRLAMRTFDTVETSGQKDYSETLIFKGGKFRKGDGAEAENDGGELLAYLPNGGQAALLVNGQGTRVEEAASLVANDTQDRRLNQGVRNPGSCWTCHAPSAGLIPPRDLESIIKAAGIKRKFKDPQKDQRYREFFEGLEEGTKQYTEPYQRLIERTTEHPTMLPFINKTANPWTGADIARVTTELRDTYDAPVDSARAARTLGVPHEVFKYLASRTIDTDYRAAAAKLNVPEGELANLLNSQPRQRPLELLQGLKIPSVTFEKDVYRKMNVVLSVYRGDETYKKLSE